MKKLSAMKEVNYSLICAVREGQLEKARQLINSFGLCYSPAWSEGYVLLCDAIKYDHTAVAKLLLKSGSRVNSKRKKPSNSPLHFAATNGDIEVVKMLLDKANIDAKNRDGRTPLHNAIENEEIEITKLLLKKRADVNAIDNDGMSPLHVAAEVGCLQIVEGLLKHGAYVNCVCTSTSKKYYAPLHLAVEKHNKKIVMLLLSRGANVNIKGEDRITPLHVSAKHVYTDTNIAEVLLNHGACINSVTWEEGYMPLHFASEVGDGAAVNLFLDSGADINASTKRNETAVHIATKKGHTFVKLFLQYGAEVDNQDKDGKTILHLAVEKGYLRIVEDVLMYCPDINNESNRSSLKIAVCGYGIEYRTIYKNIVEALLEYGFNVSPKDANNCELLHAAAEKGCLKIVESLLKYGANVNTLQNSIFEEGVTPLHTAAINKQEEVAKLLINNEADINARDKYGRTPIFYAAKEGCIEIVEALLQLDVDIKNSDKYGTTALHFTAEGVTPEEWTFCSVTTKTEGNIKAEIAKLLLDKGANVNAKQKDGLTALHIASKEGHKDVAEVLLEYGADVYSETHSGSTPLHLAAQKGYYKIIEIILKFGFDIDCRDQNGRTALLIACEEGHKEVVVTLLEQGSDINITGQVGSRTNCTPFDHVLAGKKSFYIRSDNYYHCHDDLNYFFFDGGDFYSSWELTVKALDWHIVKMNSANLYVSEKNLQSMRNSYDLRFFQEKCKKEIAIMKSEKIKNHISFYDILAKDTSSLSIYMRNENVVQLLKSDNYKTKFPIYASMIESNFRRAMEINELFGQGNKIFHFFFPELPYHCTEKILSYLSSKDLRMLINACKPLKISNPKTNINVEVITSNKFIKKNRYSRMSYL